MAQKAQTEQKEEYGFSEIDDGFNTILSGMAAIDCIQIAMAEGHNISKSFENGLYYLVNRLREDLEQLQSRVLEAVK